jgi:hypothetical protein
MRRVAARPLAEDETRASSALSTIGANRAPAGGQQVGALKLHSLARSGVSRGIAFTSLR